MNKQMIWKVVRYGLIFSGIIVMAVLLYRAIGFGFDLSIWFQMIMFGFLPIFVGVMLSEERLRQVKQGKMKGNDFWKRIAYSIGVIVVGIVMYINIEQQIEKKWLETDGVIAFSQHTNSGGIEVFFLLLFATSVLCLFLLQNKWKNIFVIPILLSIVLLGLAVDDYAYIHKDGLVKNTLFRLEDQLIEWGEIRNAHIVPNESQKNTQLELHFFVKEDTEPTFIELDLVELEKVKEKVKKEEVPLFLYPLKSDIKGGEKEKIYKILELEEETYSPSVARLIHPSVEKHAVFLHQFLYLYDKQLQELNEMFLDVQTLAKAGNENDVKKAKEIYAQRLIPKHQELVNMVKDEVSKYQEFSPNPVQLLLELEEEKAKLLKLQLDGLEKPDELEGYEEEIKTITKRTEEMDAEVRFVIQQLTKEYQEKAEEFSR